MVRSGGRSFIGIVVRPCSESRVFLHTVMAIENFVELPWFPALIGPRVW